MEVPWGSECGHGREQVAEPAVGYAAAQLPGLLEGPLAMCHFNLPFLTNLVTLALEISVQLAEGHCGKLKLPGAVGLISRSPSGVLCGSYWHVH